jgi:hypothetical protein
VLYSDAFALLFILLLITAIVLQRCEPCGRWCRGAARIGALPFNPLLYFIDVVVLDTGFSFAFTLYI